MVKLSLVIPTFQFRHQISNTLEQIRKWVAEQTQAEINVVLVDDGSQDGTPDHISSWIQQNRLNWSLIRLETNQGKGAAVRRGILAAYSHEPDFIVFTDCDLYYGLKIIFDRMIPSLVGADISIVDRSWNRAQLKPSWSRYFASEVFARLLSILTGVSYRDTQAGMKAFRAQACRPIFESLTLDGFAFDVEILSLAIHYRFFIKAIPVAFQNLPDSSSSTVSLIRSSLNMFWDLIRINLNWHRGRYQSRALLDRVEKERYLILP
jgi:dolichyl-phosphate beta-glucosyltransferase